MWVELVVGSLLLQEVFLRVLQFSPLLKNQHFQIPIGSGTHGHVSTSSYELLSDPSMGKQITNFTISSIMGKFFQIWSTVAGYDELCL